MDSTCVKSSCPHIVLGCERLECVLVDVLILSDPSTIQCVLHVLILLGSRCCTVLAVSIEFGIMSPDPPVNYVQ